MTWGQVPWGSLDTLPWGQMGTSLTSVDSAVGAGQDGQDGCGRITHEKIGSFFTCVQIEGSDINLDMFINYCLAYLV